MDKLEINKIWDDETENFCEIEIFAKNENIGAKITSYITYDDLIKISNKLEEFYFFKKKN